MKYIDMRALDYACDDLDSYISFDPDGEPILDVSNIDDVTSAIMCIVTTCRSLLAEM